MVFGMFEGLYRKFRQKFDYKVFSKNSKFYFEIITQSKAGGLQYEKIYEISIRENLTKVELYNFTVTPDYFSYSWLIAGDIDYLIFTDGAYSTLFLYDLNNGTKKSVSISSQIGIYYTHFKLSPDMTMLAVVNAIMGIQTCVKVLDFNALKKNGIVELCEFKLSNDVCDDIIWQDNDEILVNSRSKDSNLIWSKLVSVKGLKNTF